MALSEPDTSELRELQTLFLQQTLANAVTASNDVTTSSRVPISYHFGHAFACSPERRELLISDCAPLSSSSNAS